MLSCCVIAFPAWGAGPKITKIDPSKGFVDQTIRLVGDNLSKTRSVHFLVGYTDRSANFRAVSNKELEVVVPEFYRQVAQLLIRKCHLHHGKSLRPRFG